MSIDGRVGCRLLMLGGVLAGVAAPRVGHAGCNVIPESGPIYRGVVGSIDRPFLSPDPDERVTIRPACGSPPFTDDRFDTNGDGVVTAQDLVLTFVFKPRAGLGDAFFVAGDGRCDRFEEPACLLERLFCPRAPRCFRGDDLDLSVAAEDGGGALSFRFPETGFAGPVAIAVTPATAPAADDLRALPCAKLVRHDLLACIDTLAPPGDGDCEAALAIRSSAGSAAFAATSDPPAEVSTGFTTLLAEPPSNDYQAVCYEDQGILPHCTGTAKQVRYTLDRASGTIDVPMLWRGILRKKGTGADDFDRRDLRGSTALEAFNASNQRIVIPSAAFLQTVNTRGGGFAPLPIFIPNADRPNELTLIGTADKGKSTLRFFPRLLWSSACDGGVNAGQACEAAPVDHADIVDCPGGSCAAQSSARYYACRDGTRAGLPCTRPHHCPGGTCEAGSTCRVVLGADTGKWCETDAGDTGCAAGQQCGLGLFEFRDRVSTQGEGLVDIAAGFGDRGVCASGSSEGELCFGPLSCQLGLIPCVQYRAEAEQYQ